MARQAPNTKIMFNGEDVSNYVFSCNLPRFPASAQTVEIVLEIDSLEVEADGTLVINIDTFKE